MVGLSVSWRKPRCASAFPYPGPRRHAPKVRAPCAPCRPRRGPTCGRATALPPIPLIRMTTFAGAAYPPEPHDRYSATGFLATRNVVPARHENHLACARPLPVERQAYVAALAALLRGDGSARGTVITADHPVLDQLAVVSGARERHLQHRRNVIGRPRLVERSHEFHPRAVASGDFRLRADMVPTCETMTTRTARISY